MMDIHTSFQLPSSKIVALLEIRGQFYPLGPSPLRGGDGVNFSKSTSYYIPHNNFQLYSFKTEIVVKRGQFNPKKLNFLDLLHMRDTHTNFQLPTSKTDLTYNRSQMGAFLPPGTLPGGVGGGKLNS